MTRWISIAALLFAPACIFESRSPFTRPPSVLAVEEPCRFMGTFHKESRQRIEELRACAGISHDEWLCMARALETLDDGFTVRCRQTSVDFEDIAEEQRTLYAACLAEPDGETVQCGLLSSDRSCLTTVCS